MHVEYNPWVLIFLIPAIMFKLPAAVRLQIAWVSVKELEGLLIVI